MHYQALADIIHGSNIDSWEAVDSTQPILWHGHTGTASASLTVKHAPELAKTETGVYQIRQPTELDALAAEHVAEESPEVYWEDSYARFRFETLSEALEALRDPLIQGFLPREQLATTVIEEIREFPPYSSCCATAWKLVEKLSHLPFSLDRQTQFWTATFGNIRSPEVKSAPIAICLAALKVKRLEVFLTAAL
jgi:hypothetical protein